MVDTGASINVIDEQTFSKFSEVTLKQKPKPLPTISPNQLISLESLKLLWRQESECQCQLSMW